VEGLALLTVAEAAELLRLRRSTMYMLVERRQIPYVRLSKRAVRFRREALDEYVREREVAPRGVTT